MIVLTLYWHCAGIVLALGPAFGVEIDAERIFTIRPLLVLTGGGGGGGGDGGGGCGGVHGSVEVRLTHSTEARRQAERRVV